MNECMHFRVAESIDRSNATFLLILIFISRYICNIKIPLAAAIEPKPPADNRTGRLA